MPSPMVAETEALIQQLEASLRTTPPEMLEMVQDQIRNLRKALDDLQRAAPQMDANRRLRPPLSEQARALFTPQPPVAIPTWIADDIVRNQLDPVMLRCSDEATVYYHDDGLACAIPRGVGTIPTRHGLSVGFYHSGRLRYQSLYELGLMRWSISYHANGGRETSGWFADRAEHEHNPHGLHTTQSSNGIITTQAEWLMGVRHGWTKMWEDDGYPVAATLYDQGHQVRQVTP